MNWYKIAKEENWYTEKVASDPNTYPDILRKILERDNDDWISQSAVQNPNCSPDALKMVLERGKNDWVSRFAVRNPNCPPELLKMILERRKDDGVSRFAAKNPNCPPLDKILWMKATGRIGVEDPNDPKQFIEYEETKEEKVDTDLQKLRDLRNANNKKNWYKMAKEKQLILIRGISGSGKSTMAKDMAKGGIILSSDDFFMINGKYEYDPKAIGYAHWWNKGRTEEAMKQGITPIIIDNTNARAWEAKPYVLLSQKYGYQTEIKETNTPWKFDVEELVKRNKHNVPKEAIEKMIQKWEPNITIEDILKSEMPNELV